MNIFNSRNFSVVISRTPVKGGRTGKRRKIRGAGQGGRKGGGSVASWL